MAWVNPMPENTVAQAVIYVLRKNHYKIDLGIAGHINSCFYSVGFLLDAGMHVLIYNLNTVLMESACKVMRKKSGIRRKRPSFHTEHRSRNFLAAFCAGCTSKQRKTGDSKQKTRLVSYRGRKILKKQA